ncbi:DUF1153 domain-containing protein [Sphingomonas bacterium]|uniref:DUF1153 domain-containing protein n=1 Tax=Sphingomonas bacterium TaxID=1895847 RepID=UPI001576604A
MRWTASRKAEILRQLGSEELTVRQAIEKYALSEQEIALWRRAVQAAGVHALRTTRIQNYREVFEDYDQQGK